MDFEKYPYLRNIGGDETEPGEELVPSGWAKRFFQMCDEINAALEEAGYPKTILQVVQIKEKFGTMRFFYDLDLPEPTDFNEFFRQDNIAEKVMNIVDKACAETGVLCVNCGAPAEYCSSGWIIPFCKKCAEVSAEKQRATNPALRFEQLFVKIQKL